MRLAKDGDLDQALYHWFVQTRSDGIPVSGPILCAQAQKLDRELNGESSTFKASSGWLMRWKTRHGIASNAISGEIKSADNDAADDYPLKLWEILEAGGYSEEQVYNCDETGLCFKMLPRKTLSEKRDPNKKQGVKEAKDRVTVLLTVNKTGNHKLKPLCIGKSKNPRAMHHVNRKTLPCVYDNSKNAWMTSVIFENWFHSEFVPSVRRYLVDKNIEPKALLLLDNCPAHPPAENLVSRCGKIKVSYLPKNTTSMLQPLDQGIIATLKCNYRREMITKLVNEQTTISECLKSLDIKEVIYLLGKAWQQVSSQCIEACWNRGLGKAFDDFDGFDMHDLAEAENRLETYISENIPEPERVLEIQSEEVREWIQTNDTCETYGSLSDREIVDGVLNKSECQTEPEDDADVEMPPSAKEALEGLEIGLRWLETQDVDAIRILHLRNIVDFAKSQKARVMKQKSVLDFFKKK